MPKPYRIEVIDRIVILLFHSKLEAHLYYENLKEV